MEQQLTDRLRAACEAVAKKWPEKEGFTKQVVWAYEDGNLTIDLLISLAAEFDAVVWYRPLWNLDNENEPPRFVPCVGMHSYTNDVQPDPLSACCAAVCAVMEDAVR